MAASSNVPSDPMTHSESFQLEARIKGNTPAAGNTKDVKIALPLKCLGKFCRTLEMFLINCEISLISTWSITCVIINSTAPGKFTITDTNFCVPVVTLANKDDTKLLGQLNST